MPSLRDKRRLCLNAFSLICLLCLIFYANSLFNPFIWDDEGLIIKNPFIRNPRQIWRVFTPDPYSSVLLNSNFYRPLQLSSFILDYRLWQLNPFGYHLTNIILQGLVSFLAFLLLLAICGKADIALCAALLFALSPLHTEAVTYISGRADLLMGLFALLSLLLFIKSETGQGRRPAKTGYLALSLISFALSLFSKELAIAFPAVIFAWVFFYFRKNFQQRFYFSRRILPFILVGLAYLGLRAALLRSGAFWPGPDSGLSPLWLRIAVFPEVIFTYAKLLLLPVNLHMSRTLLKSLDWLRIALLWLALSAITLAFIFALRKKQAGKNLCFMLAWALAFFLPQCGIFPINAMAAEHFIYLSSLSFYFFLAWLLRKFLRPSLFAAAATGLALSYGALTIGQNYRWRNPAAFYQRISEFSPGSFMAHNNLRLQYERKGLYELALAESLQAWRLRPRAVQVGASPASLYFRMGKFPEAERAYLAMEKLISYEKAGELQKNIGLLYERQGRLEQALERFRLALRLEPKKQVCAHLNIARIYLLRGEDKQAEGEITVFLSQLCPEEKGKAAQVKVTSEYLREAKAPEADFEAYNSLGIKFAGAGLFAEAEACFQRLLEQAPDFAGGYFNLGLLYWKAGRLGEAEEAFRTALALDPGNDKARCILAQLQEQEQR